MFHENGFRFSPEKLSKLLFLFSSCSAREKKNMTKVSTSWWVFGARFFPPFRFTTSWRQPEVIERLQTSVWEVSWMVSGKKVQVFCCNKPPFPPRKRKPASQASDERAGICGNKMGDLLPCFIFIFGKWSEICARAARPKWLINF